MFQCVAIDDVNPQAPVHFLVLPRKPIPQLSKAEADDEKVDDPDIYFIVHLTHRVANCFTGRSEVKGSQRNCIV